MRVSPLDVGMVVSGALISLGDIDEMRMLRLCLLCLAELLDVRVAAGE